MNNSDHDYEYFLNDPKFRQWVDTNSPSLNLFWTNWIKTHPESLEAINEARTILEKIASDSTKLSDKRKDKLWSAIDSSINTIEDERETGRESKILPIHPVYERKKPHSKTFNIYKLAAAVALVVCSIYFLWEFTTDETSKIAPKPQVATIVKSNPPGQRSTIFLPDGSKVILGSESEITYESNFQETNRAILLKGEAFFDVEKNPNLPFTVESSGIITTALGTSFNVKSNRDFAKVEVSLVTGEVVVETDQIDLPKQRLLPGQQAHYSSKARALEKRNFDLRTTIGWKDGILIFQKSSSNDVFNRLTRWYGVKFEFINQPKIDWTYTGDFDNVSLEHVLKGLSFVKDFDYIISGKNVKIKFNK